MANRKIVVAIVQARMNSTRLPGKVLMDIAGKPMLWHILARLKYSKLINKTVVATTRNRKDDFIEDFCKNYNVDFYRGSEEDVLDRYYQTAGIYKADLVVRITADCPLIDPQVTDKIISGYFKNMRYFDGASNLVKRSYPIGLDTEAFSSSIIEEVWKKAKKNYQREHPTTYIYEHLDLFNIYSVENSEDLSSLRWTIDEEADLRFVREIYNRLYEKKKIFLMRDILKILKKEPFLQEINKYIKQKIIIK